MDNKKVKSNADKLHNVKMKTMLEDSIQITDPNKNYIKINDKKIEDIIRDNAEKMLTINGEIDLANIVNNDIVDLNLLSLYDSNNNLINYDLEGVRKGKEYWEEKIDEYIKTLQDRLNADLSSISKDELKELIVSHNREFLTTFVAGIKANALDLADSSTQVGYANRLANTITDLQAQEIQKIGIEKFLKLDLDKKPYKITYYIDKDTLKKLQDVAKSIYDRAEEKYKNIKDTALFKSKEQLTFDFLVSDILVNAIGQQIKRAKDIYKKDKKFYDSRHKKYKKIDKLLVDISKKYKELNDYLSIPALVDISKASNTIATGYTFIDNRLQKELEKLRDKTENPLDLKLDYQATYKGKGHKKKPISTPVIVAVDINNNMDIQGGSFTAFDKWVLNRAFSLWQVNKTHLSPELIYKDFINKDVDMTQMGTDIYNAILNSTEKFRTSTMSFIFQDPATIKRLGLSSDEIEFIGKNRYILPLDKSFIKYKNGRIKYDYTYMGEYEPQYFVLAEKIGQIKTADRELIPTKTGFSMTKERILMIDFLTRHIEFLKSTKGNSKYNNDISYDTIINKCDLLVGIDEGTPKYRQYKKRYRDDIKNILEQYKRDDIIKSYAEYPKDAKIKKGITINI